jgi:hypothetical protein
MSYTHIPFEALPLQDRIGWIESRADNDCYCSPTLVGGRCPPCLARGAVKEVSMLVNKLARELERRDVDRGDTMQFVFPLSH